MTELKAAVSTNKFHMLSIENWSEILFIVSPEKFPKEVTMLGNKAWLCKVGCWIAGLNKDSAIPSRVLRVVANTIRARADQIYGSRYDQVVIVADDAGCDLDEKHDFTKHPGSFFAEYTEPEFQAGFIHHRGTAKHRVPIPPDFKGTELTFLNNHDEHLASLQGKFSDPLISRIFKEGGIELPKPFYLKKITDNKEITLLDDNAQVEASTAVLRSATLAAHNAAFETASRNDSAGHSGGVAPDGTGENAPPAMPAA